MNDDWKRDEGVETEEGLGALLRAAGPRPEPPEEELAAIREAARAEWRATVGESDIRARRRSPLVLALAASLLLALGAVWWWSGRVQPSVAVSVATLERVRGDVSLGAAEARAPASAGVALVAGTVVETAAGGDAATALRLASGHSVRLHAGTRVLLTAADRLELSRGAVYVDSGVGERGAIAVVTELGVVRDIGTQFEVRLEGGEDGSLRVRVREGAVTLENGGRHEAAAGDELRLLADGRLERASVARTGAAWEWAQEVAPALDIDGATLVAYLDWFARETGLEVEFSPVELTEAASTVRLHGTINGLSPRESLDVVLPGSGLRWAVEGERLVLTRSP